MPKGQFEAAQAQGFNYLQRMGYIILPQSIPVMLPPMVNQVVNLFKNTSCLYIVGGADLISVTYSFVTGASTGGAYAPAYVVCGLIFFVVCFPLSTLAARWEASLKERKGRVNTSLKTAAKKVELKEAADMKTLAASLSILTREGVLLYLLRGVAFTCIISVLGVIMGLIVGSLLALARTYCKKGPARILGWFATAYIELFRNSALLLWIFILCGVLPHARASSPARCSA